jgi:hypothetical protein
MTDKNLLLQDDAFAPPVPDTLEHLPSFYTEPADRRVLQAEGKHPAPCARFCESNAYEIELRQMKARIAELDRENQTLRNVRGVLWIDKEVLEKKVAELESQIAAQSRQEPIGYVTKDAISALEVFAKQNMLQSIRIYNQKQDDRRIVEPLYAHPPAPANALAIVQAAETLANAVQNFRNLPLLGQLMKLRATAEYNELCVAWDAYMDKQSIIDSMEGK